jgi:hypothetical protein
VLKERVRLGEGVIPDLPNLRMVERTLCSETVLPASLAKEKTANHPLINKTSTKSLMLREAGALDVFCSTLI